MRRGLKPTSIALSTHAVSSFKPIPDEEGTETSCSIASRVGSPSFKPIPDEEGTETGAHCADTAMPCCFKPIPDEEGTETSQPGHESAVHPLQTDPR